MPTVRTCPAHPPPCPPHLMAQTGGLPLGLLWLLALGPWKPSGGSWSCVTGGWLWPETRTLEQALDLLVSERSLALLSQDIHSQVQKLFLPLAASMQRA